MAPDESYQPPVPPTSPQPPPPPPTREVTRGPGAAADSTAAHRAEVRDGLVPSTSPGGDDTLVLSRNDLRQFHADTLHELAGELRIGGRSSMNKSELIDALLATY